MMSSHRLTKKVRRLAIAPFLAAGLILAGCSRSEPEDAPATRSPTNETARSESVRLQWQWPEGKRLVHRLQLEEQNRLQLPGRPNPLVEEISVTQDYALTAAGETAAGGREIEETFLTTKMAITVNGRPVLHLDTSRDESVDGPTTPQDIFRNLVGMGVSVTLDASNHITKISGQDGIKNSVIAQMPPQARSILSRVYTEDFFGQLVLPNHLRGLGPREARPGDTWTAETEIRTGSLGQALLKLAFTFEKWDTMKNRSCALLHFEGTLATVGEGGSGPMGMKTRIDRGTVSGRSWFDPDLGQVIASNLEQTMDMVMTMNVPRIGDKGGGTQTMANHLRQSVQARLLDIDGIKL